MLGMVLVSNLSIVWALAFTMGHKQQPSSRLNSSFARCKSILFLSAFFQIVAFFSGFADSTEKYIGGRCTEDNKIPYLFDCIYGMQAAALFIFMLERTCCFSRDKPLVEL